MLRIAVGSVIYAEPFTHVYGVQETIGISGRPVHTAIAIGSYGNSISGVQVQHAYNPGDTVLFVYDDDAQDPRTYVAYILGNAPLYTQLESKLDDYVAASAWDSLNLSALNVGVFSTFETMLTRPDGPIHINAGHGSKDMLPGDHEAAGEMVSAIIGDYIAGFRGNCSEVLVSSIDRRLMLNSMLRTESTIGNLSDIAIVGRSTIHTTKHVGNIDQAFYDQLIETENGIEAKPNAKEPIYRNISVSGDAVYGKHSATLSYDGKTVLYKDFEANDGTKTTLSASGLRLGRVAGLRTVSYNGKRLNSSSYNPEPDTASIDYQIPGIVSGDDWGLIGNEPLLEGNVYPDTFVDTAKSGYDDIEPIEITDPQQPDEKLLLTPGKSDIYFRPDGSILLTDAWGSYILMSHGNVEIHARNNLFTVASRDHLAFVGGTKVDFAEQNIEQQAYKGNIKMLAGDRLALQSEKSTVLESKAGINILSKTLSVDSLNITVTGRDIDNSGGVSGGGSFKLLMPGGDVHIAAAYTAVVSDYILQAAANSAISLGTTITATGNLDLNGGLEIRSESPRYTVLDMYGKSFVKSIGAGTGTAIKNTVGDIQAAGYLTSDAGVFANGMVAGTAICKQNVGVKEHLGGCGNIAESTAIYERENNDIPNHTINTVEATELKDVSFSFDTESKACNYIVAVQPPKNSKNELTNDGYRDKNNITGYIYPGEEFWRSSGIMVDGGKDMYGFEELPIAEANNKKKGK